MVCKSKSENFVFIRVKNIRNVNFDKIVIVYAIRWFFLLGPDEKQGKKVNFDNFLLLFMSLIKKN